MGKHRLLAHPDTPAATIKGVDVELFMTDGDDVLLSFAVRGSDSLVLPEPSSAGRCDGLWKTTCFECFLRPASSEGYFEFNFSPSGKWAAYAFEARRRGMRDLELSVEPHVECYDDANPDDYVCDARLDLSDVPSTALRIGLSAIIVERDGTRSYWALAHAPGKPDFHHPDCFTIELPPAG